MTTKRICACLAASLATLVGESFARSQISADWPTVNATPQQTRFADIVFGGPPAGVLWHDPYSADPSRTWGPTRPVIGGGLLVFGFNSASGLTTRIYDADNGRCLFTFPETYQAVHAVGKLGTQTTLFRGVIVPDAGSQTCVVILTAYDLGPLMARIPGAEPTPVWSSQYFLTSRMAPFLNHMEGALYLGNTGGTLKIDAATGSQLWTDYGPASNAAVGDVWVAGQGGPRLERLVITAGWGNNTIRALYDRDGSVAWEATAERAQYVTLVKVPSPTGPLDAWRVVVPIGLSMASLLCLNASDGSVMPNWPKPLKANCYAANGPVAVRYLYDASGSLTNVAIFVTPGSDEPADAQHPLFAFDLNGNNAWPRSLPNPIQLPAAAAWTEPAVTRDRVFLTLQDGRLYSVDLNSGKSSVDWFGAGLTSAMPLVADNGHGPVLYAFSYQLGYVALAPNDRFQPHVPSLTISLTATNAVFISWPSPSTGYVLEQNSDLGTTNWVGVAQAPADNGTNKSVVINPSVGKLFYRLKK